MKRFYIFLPEFVYERIFNVIQTFPELCSQFCTLVGYKRHITPKNKPSQKVEQPMILFFLNIFQEYLWKNFTYQVCYNLLQIAIICYMNYGDATKTTKTGLRRKRNCVAVLRTLCFSVFGPGPLYKNLGSPKIMIIRLKVCVNIQEE